MPKGINGDLMSRGRRGARSGVLKDQQGGECDRTMEAGAVEGVGDEMRQAGVIRRTGHNRGGRCDGGGGRGRRHRLPRHWNNVEGWIWNLDEMYSQVGLMNTHTLRGHLP